MKNTVKRIDKYGEVYYFEFEDGNGNGAYLNTSDGRWFWIVDGVGEIERCEEEIEIELNGALAIPGYKNMSKDFLP